MRKGVIICLLAIICVSSLSSLLSGYLHLKLNKVLLDTVDGVVGAGNFSYWQLGHTGPLIVKLISLSGDADLYVSDNVRPSYEIDRNNFSSVTCGPDIVNIPTNFPRPIGIGVFGHWSHSLTEYSILVFLDTTVMLHEQLTALDEADQGNGISDKTEMEEKKEENVATKKTEIDHRPRLVGLLNFLDMIFEMLIL